MDKDTRFVKSGDCVVDTTTKTVYVEKESVDRLLKQQEKNILEELNTFLEKELKEISYAKSENFVIDEGVLKINKCDKMKCKICGCTDEDCRQCIEKTGHPCHWVAPNLCSACEGETPKSQNK